MRTLLTLALITLTACGSDRGTAPVVVPPVPAIAAVRADSAVWLRDSVTFVARNVGRAAQWRLTSWGDQAACPIGTPNNIGCDPQVQCPSSGAALIDASARLRLTARCGSQRGWDWLVIETQDASSPAWQRTACLSRVGPCPAALQPQR